MCCYYEIDTHINIPRDAFEGISYGNRIEPVLKKYLDNTIAVKPLFTF
jgi:hypothetical protein